MCQLPCRTTTSFTILPPNLCTKTFDRSIEMLCNSHFMELFNKSFHDYLRYLLQCFGSMERMRALVWVMFIVMFSSGREGWVMWNDWRALLPITYFTIKMTSTHRTLKCLSSLPQPHFVDSLVQGDQNTCPGIIFLLLDRTDTFSSVSTFRWIFCLINQGSWRTCKACDPCGLYSPI